MSVAVERLLCTAAAEVGYHEKASVSGLDSKTGNPGGKNYTKYARDLDALGDVYNGKKQGHDWCDVFVDWCFLTTFGEELGMRLLCQPYKGCGAGCRYSMGYYQEKGRFHRTGPRPGDQVFFGSAASASHTGLVESVREDRVYTIEGNTKGGVQVARKSYSLSDRTILGYGRPDWALAEGAPDGQEKEDEDMLTYEQFEAYMDRHEKERAALPGSGWSEADRDWAAEKGLFRGTGGEAFAWQSFLTREQAAALFRRFAEG